MPKSSRTFRNILAWTLAALLAFLFTYIGGVKLSSLGTVQEFAQIGLQQWIRGFTGFLEISGAIGVLIPKIRFWAALQIAEIMAGTTVTNLTILHLRGMTLATTILMLMALLLAWVRRPSKKQLSVPDQASTDGCGLPSVPPFPAL